LRRFFCIASGLSYSHPDRSCLEHGADLILLIQTIRRLQVRQVSLINHKHQDGGGVEESYLEDTSLFADQMTDALLAPGQENPRRTYFQQAEFLSKRDLLKIIEMTDLFNPLCTSDGNRI
jgi:hypothetical protein